MTPIKIESVSTNADKIKVVTTGAIFELGPSSVQVSSRIPSQNRVGSIDLDACLPWLIDQWHEEEFYGHWGAMEVKLGADGFLQISSGTPRRLRFVPGFVFSAKDETKLATQMRCTDFGCGIYRLPGTTFFTDEDTQIVDQGHPFFFHSFPPRNEDPRMFANRISHEGRPQRGKEYPSDKVIKEAALHTKIFTLHAYFWHEEDRSLRPRWSRYRFRKCPWRSKHHVPEDELQLSRVMKTVREADMKFVAYVSPRYSTSKDILGELIRLMDLYDFDGFYLDGLRGNFVEQRQFIVALRKALTSEKIIYLNGSHQPFNTPRITAPFIDTHCDYVLRGDSGRGGRSLDDFLRLSVSGRGAGNHVGVWCHYGSSGFPIPFDRVPSRKDQRAAHDHHVQLWRRSFWWPGKRSLAEFDRYQSNLTSNT